MRLSPTRQDLSLEDLLDLIEAGAFGLPDFQRPFGWKPDRVRSLLATVFMGWPAGLLLLMEAPPTNFFAVRALEGMPESRPSEFRHLVLDGQQRLTALAQAFGLTNGSNESVWYLDLAEFERGYARGEIEPAFVRRPRFVHTAEESLLVPLSALRGPSEFQRWRDRNPALIDESDAALSTYDRLNRLWVELLSDARRFQFPCSVLPAEMPLSEVATIFEKLNTAGMTLGTFDLVVAHVYRDGHNLRAEWESEVEARPLLQHFSASAPLIAAELIAMVQVSNTRRAGLLELRADVLWDSWSRAISAIESAASFLRDRAGIENEEQLPHRGILLALAGAAYDLGGLSVELEGLLLHWVYSRGITERFNAATNTRVVSEYKELVLAARGAPLKLTKIDVVGLAQATRRANSSAFLTVQAMIRRRGPDDYPDGLIAAKLSSKGSNPVSILGNPTMPYSDRVLGVILGSTRTQTMVNSRSLRETREQLSLFDRSQVAEFLDGQMLPPLGSVVWNDAEEFIRYRAKLIASTIQELLTGARDLERSRHSQPQNEPTVDLVRDWLSSPEWTMTSRERIGLSKRIADALVDLGRPDQAAAALKLLLDSQGPWSLAERISLELIRARALVAAGSTREALATLERAQRDSLGTDLDTETEELQPLVAAELGSLLLKLRRPASAIIVLRDALNDAQAGVTDLYLRVGMTLQLAEALVQVGDSEEAKRLARELLDDASLGVMSNFPDVATRALAFIISPDL